jgi:hypothetical protein
MRDSGLPACGRLRTADVLLGKFNKDISFAIRRGTITQVTTHTLDGYVWPARRRAASRRGLRHGVETPLFLNISSLSYLSCPLEKALRLQSAKRERRCRDGGCGGA